MESKKFLLLLMCIYLTCWLPVFAQNSKNSECEIYRLISTFLKDSTHFHKPQLNEQLPRLIYVWKYKTEFGRGHLMVLREQGVPDSLLIWDNFSSAATKNKKFKCKLDKELPHKFTDDPEVWSVFSGIRAKKGNWLAQFSEILYRENNQQALASVGLYRYIFNTTMVFYFFLSKENERWKIERKEVVLFF